jgi:hypothetical protein
VNILSNIHANDASLPSYFFLTNKAKRNAALSPLDRPECAKIISNLFIVFKTIFDVAAALIFRS